MSKNIHPTAIISKEVEIEDNVYIGPYCIIEGNVKIGEGTKLISHVYITGWVTIGKNNTIYPGTCIGTEPQDLSYKGEKSYVEIGDNNIFRENVTIHRGTGEDTKTIIKNNCFLMVNAHVAHNCVVEDNVILVNNTMLGGHVKIGEKAFISGGSAVHQHTRVGKLAFLSGLSAISKDLPPFCIADGRNGAIKGLNLVGLKRNNIAGERLSALKELFRIFFRSGYSVKKAMEEAKKNVPQTEEVKEFLSFVETSKRGILTGLQAGKRS